MDAADSAYDYGDIQDWRKSTRNAELEESGECDNCGSKNLKRSKKGNIYCGDLCWVEEE